MTSLLAWLFCTFLEIVLLYELFLYGLRRYELESSSDPKPPRRGLLNVVGGFLAEAFTLAAFLLTSPLGLFWPFDRPVAGAPRPVVLIHGYSMTRSCLFVLAWRLRRDGYGPIHGVGYRTWFADLGEAVTRLRRTIEDASPEPGSLDVVAHSLGGLVARLALVDPTVASRVRSLVTIATPHTGTKVAGVAFEPTAREMRPGSSLFRRLGDRPSTPAEIEVTSIYSTFDATVLPSRSAYLSAASNVEIDGVGHNAMLLSAKTYELVRESIAPRESP